MSEKEEEKSLPEKKKRHIGLWLLLVIGFACGLVVWQAVSFLYFPGSLPAKDVEITIDPGMPFNTLAKKLHALGAISDPKKWILLGRWKEASGKIKSGRFRVNTGWKPDKILDELIYGAPILERVTLPEGLTWWETGKRLEQAGMVRFEDFKKVIHDRTFLRYWGIPFENAEGFLYPDTYLLMRPLELNEASAKIIVGRLIDTFWRRAGSLWPDKKWSKIDLSKNIRNTVILASIVEKETAIPQERARVAGVYANRLQKGMLLQADPTTAYGIGFTFDGRLRRKDLKDESNSYNTYQHQGLPPGPICSPGLACLQAALHPEKHQYFYFVARGDGSHTFSTNLGDHNKAVRLYLNRERRREPSK